MQLELDLSSIMEDDISPLTPLTQLHMSPVSPLTQFDMAPLTPLTPPVPLSPIVEPNISPLTPLTQLEFSPLTPLTQCHMSPLTPLTAPSPLTPTSPARDDPYGTQPALGQNDVQENSDWMTDENANVQLEVFLVTFAAVLDATALEATQPLRTLTDVNRETIRDVILDAVAHPVQDCSRGGRPRSMPLNITMLVVFQEEPLHFHVALKLSAKTRFMPLKLAVRQRAQLASHWSTTHTLFFSAVRYGTHTTDHKETDTDPLVWLADGSHTSEDFERTSWLFENSNAPFMAKVIKRRREEAAMKDGSLKRGKTKQTFTKLDFTALVLDKSLRTPCEVMEYVQKAGSAVMQAWVNKNQARLKEFLRHAEEWSVAPQKAASERETGWELVQRVARSECSCAGMCGWHTAANSFFKRNKDTVDREHLASVLAAVLHQGPGKTRRIPMIAGCTNAGKSTIFDPVDHVFGERAVQHTPSLGSTMPLANLASGEKRFLYLDEFNPVEFASTPVRPGPTIPKTTIKKLLAGQWLEVQVSQTFNNGNADVRWTQGAAITAKLKGLWDTAGPVTDEDIRHFKSRVELFTAVKPVPGKLKDTPLCPESWCQWVVRDAEAFAARNVDVFGLATPQSIAHLAFGDDGSAGPITFSVIGLADLLGRASIPPDVSSVFEQAVLDLGAIHVNELESDSLLPNGSGV